MNYKTIVKSMGITLMVCAVYDLYDSYYTAAIKEAVIGSSLYLSCYLGRIKDAFKHNPKPSELEIKASEK